MHNASLNNTLNRSVCLTQIKKLIIDKSHLYCDQIIEILNLVSNCNTLILHTILFDKRDSMSLKQNENSQLISNTNNMKNITIKHKCSLRKVKLLINLCSQLEHLTMEISYQSLISTVRFLLRKKKNINTIRPLFSLYFLKIGIIGTEQLKTLIESEKLLDDYKIKRIHDNCYLWW
ncbi:unnamed protein product [Rotaria sp. Silwood1]|nr:unnamed protein product [Rotaria sp. Silwood1]CAF3910998.1 unnamed protein product [Rotaria sp. Silwood1]CAF4024923.1 unnamed protein product [Rotaria sp. Silwood1]CAF4527067.1 unnamed protein product [Rotaria sp. Silwood1]CAF4683848.1 unnamed protein product [Rotaria sp. Silwood1]